MSNCSESSSSAVSGGDEIMLFGVRLKVDPMRKSVSMNNLSEYEPPINIITTETPMAATEDGYASADDAVPLPSSHGNRERKRGVPWTEEEHNLFLIGLQKVGKGDWRGISRNYVKTRNSTQVASHAQKYFLRRSNLNRRRRRSSLFDITTNSVPAIPNEETPVQPVLPLTTPLVPVASNVNGFSMAPFRETASHVLLPIIHGENPMENPSDQMNNSSRMLVDLNLNQQVTMDISPLSLRLSLSSTTRDSGFQAMPCFRNEEGIACVS